jgi:hypothetical protein
MSSAAQEKESESEDDIPLSLRLTPFKPQRKQQKASQSVKPPNSLPSTHLSWPVAKIVFRKLVAEESVYVCSYCRQLWFKRSVVVLNSTKRDIFPADCLTGLLSKDGKEYL